MTAVPSTGPGNEQTAAVERAEDDVDKALHDLRNRLLDMVSAVQVAATAIDDLRAVRDAEKASR